MLPMTMMIFMKKTYNMKLFIILLTIIFNTLMNQAETAKMSYMFMGDSLSFWTASLTLWLIMIISFVKINNNNFYKTTNMMMITLMLTFYNWNFLAFYILFEISMILVLVIIMMWGYQPERTEAAMFMIMMTVMVALPFMAALMMNINHLNYWFIKFNLNFWSYLSFMTIFMMKLPIFFLHFWLPKVHVESPVQGSMILAAILLKLGAYGLIRSLNIIMISNMNFMHFIISFGMWTAVLLSITCLTQTDLKTTIAYSSIVHMTMVFMAIVIFKTKSIAGSLMIMLGHGMCSAGMFFMANLMYKTSKSRSFIMNKGLLNLTPMNNFLWFCLCMSNAPMPPSLNILGEFLSFKSITNWSFINCGMMIMIMFVSSLYSIFLYYSPTHGQHSNYMNKLSMTISKNKLILTLHIIPLMLLMIKPAILMI